MICAKCGGFIFTGKEICNPCLDLQIVDEFGGMVSYVPDSAAIPESATLKPYAIGGVTITRDSSGCVTSIDVEPVRWEDRVKI